MSPEKKQLASAPGIEIYSKEWYAITLPQPGPIADAVRTICRENQLGGSDTPEIMYTTIINSIRDFLSKPKKISIFGKEENVIADSMHIGFHGLTSYTGCINGDGPLFEFSYSDIIE